MFTLVPDFSPIQPGSLTMTRKQATIAVRSGLNDDEQYGCVVPPIHLSSTYNFTGFNEPAPTTTRVAATLRVMWCSARWRSWKAAQARC
jgi:cystathionine beta-lyase/cystathionine gamma-synthase